MSFSHITMWKFLLFCAVLDMTLLSLGSKAAPDSSPTEASPPCWSQYGGWVEYYGKCLYASRTDDERQYSWRDARAWCMDNGGDLVSIHSQEEQDFIFFNVTLDVENRRYFWIGLNQLENGEGYKWSDQTPFIFEDWAPSQPERSGLQQCVYQVTDQKRTWFNETQGINVVKDEMTDPTDAPPGTMSYYKSNDDNDVIKCRRTCADDVQCAAYTLFLQTHPSDTWRGYCVGRWDYKDVREPEDYTVAGFRDHCNETWYTAHCAEKKGFICEKAIGSDDSITVPPTDTVPGYCPTDYFQSGNKCFKMVEYVDEDSAVDWQTALETCRSLPGISPDLASIHSLEESAAITSRLTKENFGFWIGLVRLNNVWGWSDNSEMPYENWAPNEPSGYNLCGEMWIYPGPAGTWNNADCRNKRGYICQVYKDSDNVISTPPATTPHTCPPGYQPYWYGCYHFTSSASDWASAEQECLQTGGNLVSIHTLPENSAVYLLADNNFPIWIGYQKVNDSYHWSDEWPGVFANWAANQPNKDHDCTTMVQSGEWRTAPCSDQHQYICKQTDHSPPTTPRAVAGICPENWPDYGEYCYYFATTNEATRWENASILCESKGEPYHQATLTSIHNEAENSFILQHIQNSGSHIEVWIGLQKQGDDYVWKDGTEYKYTRWAPGEPNDKDGTNLCVGMYTFHWPGRWNDLPCDENRQFVCKTRKVSSIPTTEPTTTPSMPPSVEGQCPDDTWMHYGEWCYLFRMKEWVTWDKAHDQCPAYGGEDSTLTAIHNKDENWHLWKAMQNSQDEHENHGWIGLYRDNAESEWQWVDGSSVEYENWKPLPTTTTSVANSNEEDKDPRECVVMESSSGQWIATPCEELIGFVCKVKKEPLADDSGGQTPKETYIYIAIGLMLAGVTTGLIVAIVVYYYEKRKIKKNNEFTQSLVNSGSVETLTKDLGLDNPGFGTLEIQHKPKPEAEPEPTKVGHADLGNMMLGSGMVPDTMV